jgi:hypothetical protein
MNVEGSIRKSYWFEHFSAYALCSDTQKIWDKIDYGTVDFALPNLKDW